MTDQPIPQQEVDPVRGLVEALKAVRDNAVTGSRAMITDFMDAVNGPTYVIYGTTMNKLYDALRTYRAWEEGGGSDSFQSEVWRWALECFGETILRDMQERCDRFIEEALELVQSLGYDRERVGALTDYVFGRPAGEPSQEVGGATVTLAALCSAAGLDMERAAKRELARIWTKVEAIRAKQAAKPTGSALPIPSPSASAPPEGWGNLTDTQRADIEAHIRGLSPGPETYTLDGPPRMWRCFHCGEIFRTTEGARLHFGDTPCAAPPPPTGVDRSETEGAPGHTDLMVTPESIDAFMEANPLPEEHEDADVTIPGSLFRDMHAAYVSDPFTERMNELIAWAEERAAECENTPPESTESLNTNLGREGAFREVANHLRQLSQGAQTDEG